MCIWGISLSTSLKKRHVMRAKQPQISKLISAWKIKFLLVVSRLTGSRWTFSECFCCLHKSIRKQLDLFLAQGQTWIKLSEIQNFGNTYLHIHCQRTSHIWCPVSQPVLLVLSVFLFNFSPYWKQTTMISPSGSSSFHWLPGFRLNSSGKHLIPSTVNRCLVWLYTVDL